MSKEEKIKLLLNFLKKSDCIFINGTPCFFNEFYTYENMKEDIPEFISIDDYEKDDNYITFKVKNINDIEFKKNFVVLDERNNKYNIKFLKFANLENLS